MSLSITAESITGHLLATDLDEVRDEVTMSLYRRPQGDGRSFSTIDGRWVGHLRRVCYAKLRFWELADLVDSAQLLVSELVTNALKHGDGQRVTCRILVTGGMIAIEVDDGSPGSRADVSVAGPDDESGRGMFIVAAYATEWGVSRDGTKTWCTLAVPACAERARP
ncbi:ATP-binding protein [Streptomyces sp. NPDC020965]|uniref:ATP-binding protein n=1 Tax=Streptomyces sp. NPDC020965 TaxID=3365105 RepID=UPI0037A03A0C